jgi:hypothetical protein
MSRGNNELLEKLSIRIIDVIPNAPHKVVSIICPVRNMSGRLQKLEKWIHELSENPQVEVVVVHDCSDDSTEAELKSICKKYQSIILIQGSYGNPGSARNAGLKICTGNWVSFWDCDDQPNTNEFLGLIGQIELINPEIGFGRYRILNENSGLVTEAPFWASAKEKNLNIVALNPGIWRIIFLRELLDGMFFKPLRMAEDQIFISEAIVKATELKFFDNIVYTYFTGSEHHLTKDSKALQDLLPAFNQTSQMLGVGDSQSELFLQTMATRQFVSGLKFGTFRTRVGLITVLGRSGMLLRPVFLKTIISLFARARRGSKE